MADWALWERLEDVVRADRYMSANEDFNALKAAVLKASLSELSAQSGHAILGWEFLLSFAKKKTFYRSHVCQVVNALLADTKWKHAFASSEALRAKAQELHPDVRAALEAVDAAPAVPAKAPPPEKIKVSGKEVNWPDWDTLEAVVQMKGFKGANDEFSCLRLAVLAADPVQLASQVAHAATVWRFVVGFGEKKSHYRSQLAEVAGILRQESGWEASLESLRGELLESLGALPDILQTALDTDKATAEAASASASFQMTVDEETAAPSASYAAPDFESLQDRLKSMMGYVEGLAGAQPDIGTGADQESWAENFGSNPQLPWSLMTCMPSDSS